jgi:purine-binding chemotaxis protein CheW
MKAQCPTAQDILRDRAQVLARRPQHTPAAGSRLQLLEFHLAAERYAIESRHVQEVLPLRDLTPLPGTPSFVLGIVNVRGRILPVFDLKKLFELPEQGVTDLHRIILVGDDVAVGLLADVVIGIRAVAVEDLAPSLPTLTGIRADYLMGIAEDRLVVLDIQRLLSDPGIIVHEEVET